MAYDLGTVRGQVALDVKQAVAAYAALRAADSKTNTALREGSQSLLRVGAGFTAVGGLALAGFGVAVKAAAEFQKTLDFFGAVTNATTADMEKIRAKALEMGRTTSFSANEVAKSFVELGKAGVNTQEIIAGVGNAVVNLAQAGDISLTASSDIIVNTMKTFQLAAKDTGNIANLLAGAANASTVDIQDLAVSLKYVGGTAASLGIPLKEVVNALGQLGNAGIRGSTGGTALRQILLQLNPASAKARKELEALGIITTNGGIAADKMGKATEKQQKALERVREAEAHLAEVRGRGNAVAGRSTVSAVTSIRQAIALRNAQERVAAAEQHLADIRAKQEAKPPRNQAQQVAQQQAIEHALERVAKARQHLTDVEAIAAARGSGGGSGKAAGNANAIAAAQERLAKAERAAAEAGIPLAKGVEKTSNLFFDAHGKAKPLGEIFQILKDHTKDLTAEQKNLAFNILFGNRAISSALILSRDGTKGFADFAKAIGLTTAAEVGRKRLDNLAGALKIFKSTIETAFIAAGTPAQKPLQSLVEFLTKLVRAFANLNPHIQTILSSFVLFFGLLTGGIGVFILTVGFVAKAVRAFREFRAALLFIKELALVQNAIKGVGIAMEFLAANPVILIIAAVVALVAALIYAYKHSETFRNFVLAWGQAVTDAFNAVINFLKPVGRFFADIFDAIKGAFGSVSKFFQDHSHLIVSALLLLLGPVGLIINVFRHWDDIKKIISSVLKLLGDFGKNVFHFLYDPVARAVKGVIGFFAQGPEKIGEQLGFIIGRVIRFVADLDLKMGKAVLSIIENILSFFASLPGKVGDFLASVISTVAGWAESLASSAARAGANFFNAVVHFFKSLPGQIVRALTAMLRTVHDWEVNLYNVAKSAGSKLYHGVVDFVSKMPGAIVGFIAAIPGKILSIVSSVKNAAVSIGSAVFHGIADFIARLPSAMGGILNRMIGVIRGAITSAFNAVKDFATGMWNGFKKGLGIASPSFIEKAMTKIVKNTAQGTHELRGHIQTLNGISRSFPRTVGGSSDAVSTRGTNTRNGSSITMHNKFYNPVAEKSSDAFSRRMSVYANLGVVDRPRAETAEGAA